MRAYNKKKRKSLEWRTQSFISFSEYGTCSQTIIKLGRVKKSRSLLVVIR